MTTLTLPSAVTLEQASAVLRELEQAVARAEGALRVDVGALDEVDTAAVALLLHARRLAQARGLGFELTALPPKLAALATLYGVDPLLAASATAT